MIAKWLMLTITIGVMMSCNNINSEEINDKRMVHQTMKEAADSIQEKYGLQFGGIFEQGDKKNNNKYQVIGLMFSTNKYISKPEARKLVLDASKIFLEKLNTENNRPFLTVFPFTENNIEIDIIVKNKARNFSEASYFGNTRGKLYYWYDIPDEKYKTRKENELYPEAQRIIEQEEHKSD